MKNFLLVIIVGMLLGFSPIALAQDDPQPEEEQSALAQKSFDKINEVMKRIYDHILTLKEKGRYKELADFDEKALTKNAYGIFTLQYATEVPSAGGQTTPFEFALTVEIPKDKTYKGKPGYFTYPMPMLGLQFVGYKIKHPYRRQFDIAEEMDTFGEEMVDYQQQFMPLQMYVVPSKQEYEIGEEIFFKVVLANVSKHNVLVNTLSKESLYFLINNKYWGILSESKQEVVPPGTNPRMQAILARQAARRAARSNRRRGGSSPGITTQRGYTTKVGDQLILRSGEALTMDFSGESFMRPQDVMIRGIYHLNIKGLKPTTTVKIKIIKEAPVEVPAQIPLETQDSKPKVIEK